MAGDPRSWVIHRVLLFNLTAKRSAPGGKRAWRFFSSDGDFRRGGDEFLYSHQTRRLMLWQPRNIVLFRASICCRFNRT